MISLLHIHPMVVHLPIVLLMAAVLLGVVVAAWGDTPVPCWCLPQVFAATLSLGAHDAAPAAALGALVADGAAAGFPEAVFPAYATLVPTALEIFQAAAFRRGVATWLGVSLSGPTAGLSPWPASPMSGC